MACTRARDVNHTRLPPVLVDAAHTPGWRTGMEAVTLAILGDALGELQGPVLEVGFGDGDLLATLTTGLSARHGVGLDLNPFALLRARIDKSALTLMQANAMQIPCGDGVFGALLALDVFDQQGIELAAALAESRRALRSNGLLMLRVSAHTWLYGPHDIAFNTGRRYGREEIMSAVAAAGFHVMRWTYANSLLSPFLIPQRWLQRWRIAPWQASVYRAGWSNRLVAAALKTEARWLRQRDLRFGLSLIVVAKKRAEL